MINEILLLLKVIVISILILVFIAVSFIYLYGLFIVLQQLLRDKETRELFRGGYSIGMLGVPFIVGVWALFALPSMDNAMEAYANND